MTYAPVFTHIHALNKLKMRVLKRNASDEVNPIILIQFGSQYLTRLLLLHAVKRCKSLVRLHSFGSLVLWISLRLPPDLLHR